MFRKAANIVGADALFGQVDDMTYATNGHDSTQAALHEGHSQAVTRHSDPISLPHFPPFPAWEGARTFLCVDSRAWVQPENQGGSLREGDGRLPVARVRVRRLDDAVVDGIPVGRQEELGRQRAAVAQALVDTRHLKMRPTPKQSESQDQNGLSRPTRTKESRETAGGGGVEGRFARRTSTRHWPKEKSREYTPSSSSVMGASAGDDEEDAALLSAFGASFMRASFSACLRSANDTAAWAPRARGHGKRRQAPRMKRRSGDHR